MPMYSYDEMFKCASLSRHCRQVLSDDPFWADADEGEEAEIVAPTPERGHRRTGSS